MKLIFLIVFFVLSQSGYCQNFTAMEMSSAGGERNEKSSTPLRIKYKVRIQTQLCEIFGILKDTYIIKEVIKKVDTKDELSIVYQCVNGNLINCKLLLTFMKKKPEHGAYGDYFWKLVILYNNHPQKMIVYRLNFTP